VSLYKATGAGHLHTTVRSRRGHHLSAAVLFWGWAGNWASHPLSCSWGLG